MLFQALDNKKECYAIFYDGDIYHYPNSLDLTHTWSYTPHVDNDDENIEYANIWVLGRTLDEICPDHLQERWGSTNQRAKAYLTSFYEAKINLDDICFYDAVPKKFLIDYFQIKSEITDWVFNHYKKPKNYNFLLDLSVTLEKIKKQNLNLTIKNLDFIDPKVRKTFSKIKESPPRIEYNPWSTVTGRLTTTRNSFPILTLNKELRSVISPVNDLFLELDYNSAELRTFFALLGKEQPKEDIHTWIGENIFNMHESQRDEIKKKVFAWLYNPKAKNAKLSAYFDRDKMLKKYHHGSIINTPAGRTIEVGEDKALNYLIQSSASDLFLKSMIKVAHFLEDRKSFISFCIHDSLVIDFAREDQPIVEDLMALFADTDFGIFKTNLSIGKNFGCMKKVN